MFDSIKAFINGEIDSKELENHIDAASWIDYYIGLNIFSLYDDVFHNMVFHSRADKAKFYAFFYDLDNALIQDYNVHFLEYCENRGVNSTDFWRAFIGAYKDSIINRYAELRKSVLSMKNIQGIYKAYIAGIPEETINREISRWGNGNPAHFDVLLTKLEKRMNWLDNNYFDL